MKYELYASQKVGKEISIPFLTIIEAELSYEDYKKSKNIIKLYIKDKITGEIIRQHTKNG